MKNKHNGIKGMLCLFLLSGCMKQTIEVDPPVSNSSNEKGYIMRAELSEEEKRILTLATGDDVSIWDFQVDESVKTINFAIHSFDENKEFVERLAVTMGVEDDEFLSRNGRFAIHWGDLEDEIEISMMGDCSTPENMQLFRYTTSSGYTETDVPMMAEFTCPESSSLDYQVDKKIVLIMRCAFSDTLNGVSTRECCDFENPSKKADAIVAITVEFSTQPMS